MARQEASNTFQDGLISDLHPLNTPNTVLTDCLNGTIITYNGNEFILQNDMGNYELENCKLKPNFIPVGIKGYGDILYIVSYNPITKQTEIGSYPAPQSRFFLNNEDGTPAYSDDIAPYTIDSDDYYLAVIEEQKKDMFVYIDSDDEEALKLYPGDEFQINLGSGNTKPTAIFPYQDINFFIIDENKKAYDIDDTQITYGQKQKVFWETPGWFGLRWDLFVPTKFKLNIVNLTLPNFKTEDTVSGVSITLNTQTTIEDQEFIDKLDINHFKVKYEIQIGNENPQIQQNDVTPHNYQDDILTLYNQFTYPFKALQSSDIITISATPGVVTTGGTLWYDQFKETYQFTLDSVKNPEEIKIADSLYKWSIDSNSCTITFNVEGPFVNAANMICKYTIKRWNPEINLNKAPNFENNLQPILTNETGPIDLTGTIDNFIPFGENTIDIDYQGTFQAEGGIYDLHLQLFENLTGTESLAEDAKPNKEIHLILIPSITFNEFYTDKNNYMTDVQGLEWINKFLDHVNLNNFQIYYWEQARDKETDEIITNSKAKHSLSGEWYINNDFTKTEDKDLTTSNIADIININNIYLSDNIARNVYTNRNAVNQIYYNYDTNFYGIQFEANPVISYLGQSVPNIDFSLWGGKDYTITCDLKNGNDVVFSKVYDNDNSFYDDPENNIIYPNLSLTMTPEYIWNPIEISGSRNYAVNTASRYNYNIEVAGIDATGINIAGRNLGSNGELTLDGDDGGTFSNKLAQVIDGGGFMTGTLTLYDYVGGGLRKKSNDTFIHVTDGFSFNVVTHAFMSNSNSDNKVPVTRTGIWGKTLNSGRSGLYQLIFIPYKGSLSHLNEILPSIRYNVVSDTSSTYYILTLGQISEETSLELIITRFDLVYKMTKQNLKYGKDINEFNYLNGDWTTFLNAYKNINSAELEYTILPKQEFVQELIKTVRNRTLSDIAPRSILLGTNEIYKNLVSTINKWITQPCEDNDSNCGWNNTPIPETSTESGFFVDSSYGTNWSDKPDGSGDTQAMKALKNILYIDPNRTFNTNNVRINNGNQTLTAARARQDGSSYSDNTAKFQFSFFQELEGFSN